MIKLKEKYNKEVVPAMQKKFGYKTPMAVPRLVKAVVNTSFGKFVTGKTGEEQKKIYMPILEDLALICGQRPVLTRAKKSIASFKTREGMPLGAMASLRGRKMYDLLEKIINIALPRSRDFRGLNPQSFDNRGNLTVAIKESIVFPEISPEKSKSIFGFEITIVSNARKREEGIELFKMLGFPIKEKDDKNKELSVDPVKIKKLKIKGAKPLKS
jgi:large subunit ribosomal protein L5